MTKTKAKTKSKTVKGTRAAKPAKAAHRTARTTKFKNIIAKSMTPFGRLVREARLKKGLTSTELGGKLGFSAQAVIGWETRKPVNIAETNIAPLARELGLPVKKLHSLAKA